LFLAALFLFAASSVFPLPGGEDAPDEARQTVEIVEIGDIDEEDLLTLLSLSLGGRDLAVAAWVNMTPFDRQLLRGRAFRLSRAAEAARQDSVLTAATERALKWGTVSLLTDAWEKKTLAEIDLSEAKLRAFYDADASSFSRPAAVRFRQAVYPLEQKNAALRVKKQLGKARLDRLKNSAAVGWIEYGKLAPALAEALWKAPLGKVLGPVETPAGQVLYEVLERREEGPEPFSECKNRVRESLIRFELDRRLELDAS
jgi:hypothetical protein